MLRPIPPAEVARRAADLIPDDAPARQRALAVLDGVLVGHAWVDDPAAPTALLVIEDADGTVYAGGACTPASVRDALAGLATASGDLVFGVSGPHDPLRALVPADPYWRGEAIDFTDREALDGEADARPALPADGSSLVRLDRASLPLTEWYEDTLFAFGSMEAWEELGVGFAMMVDGGVASESVAGPRCRGLLEMGVVTREPYRRRGYGTLVSAAVARACEARGDRVWWNANSENEPSIRIARHLGFRNERRYEVIACRAPLPPVT
ncbi:MAG TPA: GNAT family N-acetyltransferase [Candidatus Limnocylindria bacterium]